MSLLPSQRLIACTLVLCLLIVGGLAAAESLTHESQHAQHQKTTHSSVLCSWICAAGQVLDVAGAPVSAEPSPVALAELYGPRIVSGDTTLSIPPRSPPPVGLA